LLIGPSAEYVATAEEYASTQTMMDKLFEEAEQLLPRLQRDMIIGAYTGIRAKTVPPGSGNFGDFIIEESRTAPKMINLIGIESPGLTASMPIAERVCEMLRISLGLTEKENWNPEYKGPPVFRTMSVEAKNELIRKNPDYGKIICRCENITKAEMLDALGNPLGARTLIGLKNRVRTMMGRCQGGYCLSHIVDILANELGLEPEEIVYRYPGDSPFFGRVK
jgi:glycerol-3-phosphate dehydrogenase